MLRIYLALCVLYSHVVQYSSWPEDLPFLISGPTAVCIFFIISGFYISMIYNEKYALLEHGTAKFFANRALRIYPGYWAVLLASWLLYSANIQVSDWRPIVSDAVPLLARATTLADNVLMVPGALYFGMISQPLGWTATDAIIGRNALIFGQCFTIGLEILFYLLAPLLVGLRWRWFITALIIAASLHIVPLYMGLPVRVYQYEFLPGILVFFLVGALAHRAYGFVSDRLWAARVGWCCFPAIILLVCATNLSHGHVLRMSFTNNIYVAALYVAAAVSIPFMFAAFQHSKADRIIGDASYPVYVNHLLVMMILLPFWPSDWAVEYRGFAVFGGSIMAAAVVLLTIEWPIDAFRRRFLQV